MSLRRQHRMAILTWIVVYPIVTGLVAVLEPLLGGLAVPLRTLVLTAIMVPTMVYLAMPAVTAWLADWLSSSADARVGQ